MRQIETKIVEGFECQIQDFEFESENHSVLLNIFM